MGIKQQRIARIGIARMNKSETNRHHICSASLQGWSNPISSSFDGESYVSCGGIAKTFTKDLLLDPRTRGTTDVHHKLVAAATSSSFSRAKSFLAEVQAPSDAVAYGSYTELLADPNVDIIYVATPHSHHYVHTRAALEAEKHVLCEKAFTVNTSQLRILIEIARERKLFLMEAMWTRCSPFAKDIQNLVMKGELGPVIRVTADLSFNGKIDQIELSNRLVNMDLAGGALLDRSRLVGIYSITPIFMLLHQGISESSREMPKISSTMTKFHTGADEQVSVLFNFEKSKAQGIATASLRIDNHPDIPPITIQTSLADLQLYGMAFAPTRYKIVPSPVGIKAGLAAVDTQNSGKTWPTSGGRGMYWQADIAARCIRDGKLESEEMSWDASVVIMEVMDAVRKQNGLEYPKMIESIAWPPAAGFT